MKRSTAPKLPTIDLEEQEWTDQPRQVPVTYPAEPVQRFINWLRHTKAWWEDVDLVHRRVLRLNAELVAARSAMPKPKPPMTPERRRAIALANLDKARAAKAAKAALPVPTPSGG
jgi:hypothetical protein